MTACSGPSAAPEPRVERIEEPERWLELLRAYLRIDTTNPPGHEARAFPLLETELRRIGLEPHRMPFSDASATATVARGNVWARLRATKPEGPPLVLLHHIDVVPVERTSWSVDPFAAELRDGFVYGRGAIDIKLLGVLQLAALSRLAPRAAELKRDVILLAVSDEEKDGLGAQLAVERQLAEWKPAYLLDEGGFAIESFMNDRDIVVIATAQKRVARIALVAHGSAGHGSRPIPDGGPSVLARALARLDEHPAPVRLGPVSTQTMHAFGRLSGGAQGFLLRHIEFPGLLWALEGVLSANTNLNPILRDTLTPTLLEAGQKVNVIPAEARATLDVRLLPSTRIEDVVARLDTLFEGLPIEVVVEQSPLPPYAPSATDDPLYRAMVDAVRAHRPEAEVAPWLMVGANDSRFFAPHGVATYGFGPVFLSKAQIDSIHGHDERIAVEAFEQGLLTYVEALERFLLR